MGDRPAFRIYISDAEGKFNYKRGGELCALWVNQGGSGKVYYGGKLKDGRKIQAWPVEESTGDGPAVERKEPPPNQSDVPF